MTGGGGGRPGIMEIGKCGAMHGMGGRGRGTDMNKSKHSGEGLADIMGAVQKQQEERKGGRGGMDAFVWPRKMKRGKKKLNKMPWDPWKKQEWERVSLKD